MYPNSIDELWYVNSQDKRKKRDVPGSLDANVKKNRREKYRKLKALSEAENTVLACQEELSCSTDVRIDADGQLNSEHGGSAVIRCDGTESKTEMQSVAGYCGKGGGTTNRNVTIVTAM